MYTRKSILLPRCVPAPISPSYGPLTARFRPVRDCLLVQKVNGSLPEKSEPLLSARYEPLAREAKMPKAQLSKAPAVSYCEIQLDILTKLAGRTVRNHKLSM